MEGADRSGFNFLDGGCVLCHSFLSLILYFRRQRLNQMGANIQLRMPVAVSLLQFQHCTLHHGTPYFLVVRVVRLRF